MPENPVQTLTSHQVAELSRQFRERDERLASLEPTEVPSAPLPRCPACDAETERIDERTEDPKFGVDETALLMRWLPCGHRFRAVVDLDAPPVDEYRISTR